MTDFKIKNKAFLEPFYAWMNKVSLEIRKPLYGSVLGQIGAVVAALLVLLGIGGCSSIRYVPVEKETIEKTVVKDSIIYRDSIIYLPKERIVEVVPQLDTLKMDIELASAKAYLDTAALVLKGELKSKESPKKEYIERIEYLDRTDTVYVSKPVPYEVEKPVPYIPSFYKFCLWWFIGCVMLIALWIVVKLKP